MFNFFSTNGVNEKMPPASSIKEANGHMQAMLRRICDLEQRVKEQTELMNRREAENAARCQNLERQKDLEMAGLQQDITKWKDRCKHLEGLLKERDVQIAYLFHRCSYLDEAASYVPLLDQLSQCLKSSLAAPPPKVQTVKPSRPTATATTVSQEYTPDVPIAPSNEKPRTTPTPPTVAPVIKQQTMKTHVQPYPETVAPIYAPNPSVAVNSGKH